MSFYTLSQKKSIKKYRKAQGYIELRCRVSRQKRDEIKFHAEATDGSLNKFINRAINETILRDNLGGDRKSVV